MPFTSFDFDFRFLNAKNKPTSFCKKQGSITESGVILDGQELFYHQIQEVIRFRDRLSFLIKAEEKTSLSEYRIPHTSYFMIQVDEEIIFDVKSYIDRNYTDLQAKEHRKELKAKDEEHNFRSMCCPQCQSTLDLSYIRPSKYVFCKYCEALFNQNGNYTDLEDYKVCHVCKYYNRVQKTPRVEVYFLGKNEKAWTFETAYQCDSCTERELRERFWKNLPFIIGAIADFYAKNKIDTDIDSTFDELTKANRLAYEGNLEEAIEIYESMMLYANDQPGILYNIGKAYLDTALLVLKSEGIDADAEAQPYLQGAVRWLTRSLNLCANYTPTIELFKKHADLEYEVTEEELFEDDDE